MTTAQTNDDPLPPSRGRVSRRWVYLIGSPVVRPVKIGVSDDPEERLADLQTGSPVPLVLLWQVLGGQRLESLLHDRFAACRTHGEWFDFGDADPVLTVAEEAARLGYGPLPVVPLPRQPIIPAPRPTWRVKPDTVRGRLLAALADGPAAPRELAQMLGVHWRAVYRPIERLVGQGHAVWLPDGRVTTAEPQKRPQSVSRPESRPAAEAPRSSDPTAATLVLAALAEGEAAAAELVRATGRSQSQVYAALRVLVEQGQVRKPRHGLYAAVAGEDV
ncbi:GIY-YIG nuclease family protein [Streptomyces sp. S1A]|uniref:GIY-YIG nuclease family protein n=1 Tax=Streptomyces sp. ICN903 TaxID=2964654 RepID=UPI001EDAA6C6|nr:GIY-YIG nuclease family protein [Streptomyces sp. ICN903]MCG3039187.1 GIY-YIG nuclease family protein [Streptomyces sp. ICN903]